MFQGSMVALVTPMHEDGRVDDASLKALVDWHVEQGTDAIVAVGTTGESATLDEQEHCRVIRQVVEYAAGRVPVIAGTGANATAEAIQLTHGPGNDFYPCWSPDGTKIAFSSDRSGNADIWLIDVPRLPVRPRRPTGRARPLQ